MSRTNRTEPPKTAGSHTHPFHLETSVYLLLPGEAGPLGWAAPCLNSLAQGLTPNPFPGGQSHFLGLTTGWGPAFGALAPRTQPV